MTLMFTLLLLLLRSQLDLWVSQFVVRFLRMWQLFNLIIEVVTFRPRGWCVLGVAFTGMGHECQDLLSPYDEMHVCTDYTFVYNLFRKSIVGMESEPMLTPRKNSPVPEAQRSVEPTTLHHTGQRAQHTTYWAVLGPWCSLKVTGPWESKNLGSLYVLKLHEATQMLMMVDYVREVTVKTVWEYSEYRSFEEL